MASIGLVLAGSMARGAYQVGVLNALKEVIGEQDTLYISAASVGVLNAFAFASHKLDSSEALWHELSSVGANSLVKKTGRTPYIFQTIDSLLDGSTELHNTVYTTCFNISKRQLRYVKLNAIDPSLMRDYIRASVAIPFISDSIKINGTKYCDGSKIDNIPIYPLMKYHLDYIIVVHFDSDSYTFENEYFDNKLIKINFFDEKIINHASSDDRFTVSDMIAAGYDRSQTMFDVLFKNGTNDLEYIYKKIPFFNPSKKGNTLRITGDIIMNSINKRIKRLLFK